jgi:hypothetical protein
LKGYRNSSHDALLAALLTALLSGARAWSQPMQLRRWAGACPVEDEVPSVTRRPSLHQEVSQTPLTLATLEGSVEHCLSRHRFGGSMSDNNCS